MSHSVSIQTDAKNLNTYIPFSIKKKFIPSCNLVFKQLSKRVQTPNRWNSTDCPYADLKEAPVQIDLQSCFFASSMTRLPPVTIKPERNLTGKALKQWRRRQRKRLDKLNSRIKELKKQVSDLEYTPNTTSVPFLSDSLECEPELVDLACVSSQPKPSKNQEGHPCQASQTSRPPTPGAGWIDQVMEEIKKKRAA